MNKDNITITHPGVAAEWHPTKNGELRPEDVTPGSNRKVWWQDKAGHEWQAIINNRCLRGSGCPICAGRKFVNGHGSLAEEHPMLAAEWHPTKNGDLKPTDVSSSSQKKVWWRCPNGHEWQATVLNRAHGSGCPYDAGRMPMPGVNDLATRFPEIAAEWHPTKNGELKPTDVMAGSRKVVWWKCRKSGHEWAASVTNRTHGCVCPGCRYEKSMAASRGA